MCLSINIELEHVGEYFTKVIGPRQTTKLLLLETGLSNVETQLKSTYIYVWEIIILRMKTVCKKLYSFLFMFHE